METRAHFPLGTEVQYVDSGQEAIVVSIEESEEYDEYESERELFVEMNGQIIRTNVDRIERA